jgi:hypothetical protein
MPAAVTAATMVATAASAMEPAATTVESSASAAVRSGKCKFTKRCEQYECHAEEKNPQNTRPIHFVPPQLRATAATTSL